MTKVWLVAIALLLVACHGGKGDPPPPATSVAVPVGAPGATGAMAAGRVPMSTPGTATDPDEEQEQEPEDDPLAPAPPPGLPATPDAGVTL